MEQEAIDFSRNFFLRVVRTGKAGKTGSGKEFTTKADPLAGASVKSG